MFLNTCQGAHQGTVERVGGIAQHLHAKGIANAVGLQFLVQDQTAHALVLGFYTGLLRRGFTVEEIVGTLRREMFIDGKFAQEAFGLSLYQGNETLRWRASASTARSTPDDDTVLMSGSEALDRHLVAELRAALSRQYPSGIQQPYHTSAERVQAHYSAQTILSAKGVFEDWAIVASAVDQAASSLWAAIVKAGPVYASVPSEGRDWLAGVFVATARLAKQLAYQPFEGKELKTGILMLPANVLELYAKNSGLEVSPVQGDLLGWDVRAVVEAAQKIDGQSQAFVLALNRDGERPSSILHLGEVPTDDLAARVPFWRAVRRYERLRYATLEGGCAFALVGSHRVRLFIDAKQEYELVGGQWLPINLDWLHKRTVHLAEKAGFLEDVILAVVEHAVFHSEEGEGRAFIIEGKQDLFTAGLVRPTRKGTPAKSVQEIAPDELLREASGDFATLVGRDGQIRGVNVELTPKAKLEVVPVPGAGGRHLSAQRVTAEADAIAVVVSADRPITVFERGNAAFGYLRTVLAAEQVVQPTMPSSKSK